MILLFWSCRYMQDTLYIVARRAWPPGRVRRANKGILHKSCVCYKAKTVLSSTSPIDPVGCRVMLLKHQTQ